MVSLNPNPVSARAQAFSSMAVTHTVQQCVARKAGDMYGLMLREMETVRKQFELLRRLPPASPTQPAFGLRASTASGMLLRLEKMWAAHTVRGGLWF